MVNSPGPTPPDPLGLRQAQNSVVVVDLLRIVQ